MESNYKKLHMMAIVKRVSNIDARLLLDGSAAKYLSDKTLDEIKKLIVDELNEQIENEA